MFLKKLDRCIYGRMGSPTIELLRFNWVGGNMRADMESAPTIELLRVDWFGENMRADMESALRCESILLVVGGLGWW